jgi:hypothetical protein
VTECTCDSCLGPRLTKRYKDQAAGRKLDKIAVAALAKVHGGQPGGASADTLPPFASEYGISKRGQVPATRSQAVAEWYDEAKAAAAVSPAAARKAVRTPLGQAPNYSCACGQPGCPGVRGTPPGSSVTKRRKPKPRRGSEYAAFLKAAGAPATVRVAAGTQPGNRSSSRDPEFEKYLRQIGRVLV